MPASSPNAVQPPVDSVPLCIAPFLAVQIADKRKRPLSIDATLLALYTKTGAKAVTLDPMRGRLTLEFEHFEPGAHGQTRRVELIPFEPCESQEPAFQLLSLEERSRVIEARNLVWRAMWAEMNSQIEEGSLVVYAMLRSALATKFDRISPSQWFQFEIADWGLGRAVCEATAESLFDIHLGRANIQSKDMIAEGVRIEFAKAIATPSDDDARALIRAAMKKNGGFIGQEKGAEIVRQTYSNFRKKRAMALVKELTGNEKPGPKGPRKELCG